MSLRPVGRIKIYDQRGYAYLPKIIRSEVCPGSDEEIDYFLNANCVLLVRKGATLQDVVSGLDVLKRDLELRTGSRGSKGPSESREKGGH